MKLNQLVWLGLTTFVVATAPVLAQSMTRTGAALPPVAQMQSGQAQSTTIAMGSFTAAEKPTSGSARIIQAGGQRYVELDSAFSTSNQGPDLHVLLDRATQPPASYPDTSQTINLGALQSYSGTQRYAIPDGVNEKKRGEAEKA
ncbi:MAG: DM13 domain-containing protein [Elainella sp.]